MAAPQHHRPPPGHFQHAGRGGRGGPGFGGGRSGGGVGGRFGGPPPGGGRGLPMPYQHPPPFFHRQQHDPYRSGGQNLPTEGRDGFPAPPSGNPPILPPPQQDGRPREAQPAPSAAASPPPVPPPVDPEESASIAEWNSVHAWEQQTRTIAHYERIEQIGEGTYGQVYRARCLDTDRIVALKKIRVHHGGYWGMPPTVIREIKILKRLRHPAMVEMIEVVSSKGVEHLDEDDEREDDKRRRRKEQAEREKAEAASQQRGGGSGGSDSDLVKYHSGGGSKSRKGSKADRVVDAREGYKGNLFLVLEYVSHDLTGLMDMAYRFTDVQVKCIFKQLLEVLSYIHESKYVHRDIKSSNILIDSQFRVKLADFGLARCIEPPILDNANDRGSQTSQQEFTNKVITLWYRPPELLLGTTRYGPPVDVWSAGCILAELLLGRPLLPGKTEMEQLKLIFDLFGTPTRDTWEGFEDLKLLRTGEVTIEKRRRPKLREKYGSKIPGLALNLLEKLLELDPCKRLTASRALTSRYFLSDPRAPDDPAELGSIELDDAAGGSGGNFHEFQTKKRRREAKAVAQKASDEAKKAGCGEREVENAYDEAYRDYMKKASSLATSANAAAGVGEAAAGGGATGPKSSPKSTTTISQAGPPLKSAVGSAAGVAVADHHIEQQQQQRHQRHRSERRDGSERKRHRETAASGTGRSAGGGTGDSGDDVRKRQHHADTAASVGSSGRDGGEEERRTTQQGEPEDSSSVADGESKRERSTTTTSSRRKREDDQARSHKRHRRDHHGEEEQCSGD